MSSAVHTECLTERNALSQRIRLLEKDVNGNGRKGLVEEMETLKAKNLIEEKDLEKYASKEFLDVALSKVATKEDLKELKTEIISFIKSHFNRRSEDRSKFMRLLIKGVPPVLITAAASIITAFILKS